MAKWPDTSPVLGEDGWTEHFNTHSKMFGFLELKAWYSMDQKTNPGYQMSVGGRTLKKTKPDLASAKEYVKATARSWCEKALEALKV